MAKKTLKGWHKSNLTLDAYLAQPCEICVKLYDYALQETIPQYHYGDLLQYGEPEYEIDKVGYFLTFQRIGAKFFYLGVLPKFKKPKTK